MAINRTRGTAIGGALFVSLLISGNSVSTVEANCLTDKYTEIIRSDTAEICQTYTIKKGMNYSLPGYYMYKAKDLSVENVVMNEEKIFNLKKLDQIAYLEDGWNGNTARAFEKQLISMEINCFSKAIDFHGKKNNYCVRCSAGVISNSV